MTGLWQNLLITTAVSSKPPFTDLRYFASFPNTYLYKKVTYFTTDAFFICKPVNPELIRPNKEISEIAVMKPDEIDLKRIAFESTKQALQKYREIILQ